MGWPSLAIIGWNGSTESRPTRSTSWARGDEEPIPRIGRTEPLWRRNNLTLPAILDAADSLHDQTCLDNLLSDFVLHPVLRWNPLNRDDPSKNGWQL